MLHIAQTVSQILIAIVIFWAVDAGVVPMAYHGHSAAADMDSVSTDVREQVEKGRTTLRQFSRHEMETVEKLHDLEKSLNEAHHASVEIGGQLSVIEKKIAQNQKASEALSRRLAQGERYAGQRIQSLFKLGRQGRFSLLASSESMIDLLRRKKALEHILDRDHRALTELGEQKAHFSEICADLDARKKEREAIEKQYQEQIAALNQKKADREKLLSEIRSHKELFEASLSTIKKAAALLDEKLVTISGQSEQAAPDVGEIDDGFLSQKRLLRLPVDANIDASSGTAGAGAGAPARSQSGIRIPAERGMPIHCVWRGQVIFADWFKGYGNMIIVDHGDHYYTLYAHADELLKIKGDRIDTDEVIGTVGDTGSLDGTALHFEIRHHSKPLDPFQWLKTG